MVLPIARRTSVRQTVLSMMAVLALLLGSALVTPVAEAADSGSGAASSRPSEVTLGLRRHSPPYGKGWGRVAPRIISNGGVPSGTATKLSWRRWGKASSVATGRTAAYRPDSGYYGRLVRIRMKASRLRTCNGHQAYTVLQYRAQNRPGGPMPKRWHTWTTKMCQAW